MQRKPRSLYTNCGPAYQLSHLAFDKMQIWIIATYRPWSTNAITNLITTARFQIYNGSMGRKFGNNGAILSVLRNRGRRIVYLENIHYKPRVIMMLSLPSLLALEVVVMTAYVATSCLDVGIMATFNQWGMAWLCCNQSWGFSVFRNLFHIISRSKGLVLTATQSSMLNMQRIQSAEGTQYHGNIGIRELHKNRNQTSKQKKCIRKATGNTLDMLWHWIISCHCGPLNILWWRQGDYKSFQYNEYMFII